MQQFLAWLPERFKWSSHNLISHPVSEIVYWFTGNEKLCNRIHDWTIPSEVPAGEGRG